ncbi:hypothetical protein KB1_24110 [Cutibacterium modestum]|uniref:Uncharacterized protein n=1 Tax=Cutibacterium modestum TaxID=2559073 RepID=A0AAD1NX81_9ACTN|nr:hypothetical protein KB1_24110 [Cutibacterium modestum]
MALGDRHIAWPLNDDHAAIRYSGTQESTSFNEVGVGTTVIVDLGDPLTCQTIDVGTWLHARVSQEVAGEADLQILRDRLDSFDHRDRTIIRYDLHGQVTIPQQAELDEILADYETVFASLEPSENRHDLTVVGNDISLAEADVPGWVREAAEELSGMCATNDDAVAALTLLHRLVNAEEAGTAPTVAHTVEVSR